MPDNGAINEGTTGTTGTPGAGTATALSQTAHDYGQKISEVATQAKDYLGDKVSVVGDKKLRATKTRPGASDLCGSRSDTWVDYSGPALSRYPTTEQGVNQNGGTKAKSDQD
jgi:hypothetical protein